MQVSVETTGTLARRVTVGVAKEDIAKEMETRFKSIASTAKLNGFRPGKIPMSVIKRKYDKQVRHEVLDEVVQSSFYEAVKQENLMPAGQPKIDFGTDNVSAIDLSKDFSYTADFEIYPDLSDMVAENFEIEKLVADVADADIDKMVEKLREQRQTWEAVDETAQEGHRIIIDFEGKLDGEAFEGNSAEKYPLILGKKQFIDGFEEQLVGVNKGDDRTIDVTFPEDYGHDKLAGKQVQFTIHVHDIEKGVLPEINDEFISSLGVEGGSVDSLRNDIRENMERELETAIKTKLKHQLMDALLAANDFEMPQNLIDEEIVRLQQNMESSGQQLAETDKEKLVEPAKERVKLGLLMNQIIQANDLEPSPEKMEETVAKIASTYEDPQAVMQWYFQDRKRLAELEAVVLEDEVLDILINKAQITEKQVDFDEAIKK